VPRLACAVLVSGGVVRDPAFLPLFGDLPVAPRRVESAAAAAASEQEGAAAAEELEQAERDAVAPALSFPSAHLIGAADALRGRSEQLAAACGARGAGDGGMGEGGARACVLVLRHEQGHVLPRLPEAQAEELRAWLRTHLLQG
jgi:hypothetical protein